MTQKLLVQANDTASVAADVLDSTVVWKHLPCMSRQYQSFPVYIAVLGPRSLSLLNHKCVSGVPRPAAQWRRGGGQGATPICPGDCHSRPVLGQVPACLPGLTDSPPADAGMLATPVCRCCNQHLKQHVIFACSCNPLSQSYQKPWVGLHLCIT